MDSNRKQVSANTYNGIQACGCLEASEWCGLLIEEHGVKYFCHGKTTNCSECLIAYTWSTGPVCPITPPSKTGVQFFAGVPLNNIFKYTTKNFCTWRKEAGTVKTTWEREKLQTFLAMLRISEYTCVCGLCFICFLKVLNQYWYAIQFEK